jgi:hypothetical protein
MRNPMEIALTHERLANGSVGGVSIEPAALTLHITSPF